MEKRKGTNVAPNQGARVGPGVVYAPLPAGVGGWAPACSSGGTKGPRMAHKGIGNKGPRYNDGLEGACWQAGAIGALSLGH